VKKEKGKDGRPKCGKQNGNARKVLTSGNTIIHVMARLGQRTSQMKQIRGMVNPVLNVTEYNLTTGKVSAFMPFGVG